MQKFRGSVNGYHKLTDHLDFFVFQRLYQGDFPEKVQSIGIKYIVEFVLICPHQGQLEEYISHLELKGFGGTDFRPVFKYVDNLLETGELGRVEGLLVQLRGDLLHYCCLTNPRGPHHKDRPLFYSGNLILPIFIFLLYFTDGYGSFPVRPPWYRTAFVFLDRAEDVKVPPWAMKVYLEETEL